MEKVIILTGRELGYQVVKALGKQGIGSIVIYGHERDEIAQYSRYAVESHKLPRFFDETGLVMDLLMRKADKWRGTMIIPTSDHGVKFLADNRDSLSDHYIVPTPGPDLIDTIVNKKSLYALARDIGIAVPGIHCPRSMDELNMLKGNITFPCLLKPGLGHLFSSRFDFKMMEIYSYDDLVRNYINLTQDFTHDEFNMMICDIIPGPDSKQMVQYVSYIDQSGELLASMTSRKMRQDPPRYGQGRIAKSEKVAGVDEQSRKLLSELGYRGFSEIEWKYDPRDGSYKLIEINPRFIFYIGLCVACGINFPYIQYADLVLNKKVRVDSFRENVYWIHEYKDVLHTVLNHRMETLSFWDYARPYLGKKSLAILDLKDMRPFYEQWRQHGTNMLRKWRS
ncbi:MAG TPA: hypothetical protein DDZ40_08395 [Deltaproteobacteria bacterium]|nr:hypothetical protein [Deltaproteobacteria bacterium]